MWCIVVKLSSALLSLSCAGQQLKLRPRQGRTEHRQTRGWRRWTPGGRSRTPIRGPPTTTPPQPSAAGIRTDPRTRWSNRLGVVAVVAGGCRRPGCGGSCPLRRPLRRKLGHCQPLPRERNNQIIKERKKERKKEKRELRERKGGARLAAVVEAGALPARLLFVPGSVDPGTCSANDRLRVCCFGGNVPSAPMSWADDMSVTF